MSENGYEITKPTTFNKGREAYQNEKSVSRKDSALNQKIIRK